MNSALRVDLHLHSTASDGAMAPADIPARAAAAGLAVIALTDHDTLAGVPAARAAADGVSVRVIAGCEFSVAGPGGEMHLLAYFLPEQDESLERFLAAERAKRRDRAAEIIRRLARLGLTVTVEDLAPAGQDGSIGRPHVARLLLKRGFVRDISDAFDRYLGTGKPAFVPKSLPAVEAVAALVRERGGVTSMAHLKDRGVRPVLEQLKAAGVDGVEVLHPSHDPVTANRIEGLARRIGLLPTGGSDWHGDVAVDRPLIPLGGIPIPPDWLPALERVHLERTGVEAQR